MCYNMQYYISMQYYIRLKFKKKDLGVTVRADKTVSEQCGLAAAKGNQILGPIRRNITYMEKILVITLYQAIVRPHLEYSIQAWRQCYKVDIDKLDIAQRRPTTLIQELKHLCYESRLL